MLKLKYYFEDLAKNTNLQAAAGQTQASFLKTFFQAYKCSSTDGNGEYEAHILLIFYHRP